MTYSADLQPTYIGVTIQLLSTMTIPVSESNQVTHRVRVGLSRMADFVADLRASPTLQQRCQWVKKSSNTQKTGVIRWTHNEQQQSETSKSREPTFEWKPNCWNQLVCVFSVGKWMKRARAFNPSLICTHFFCWRSLTQLFHAGIDTDIQKHIASFTIISFCTAFGIDKNPCQLLSYVNFLKRSISHVRILDSTPRHRGCYIYGPFWGRSLGITR